VPLAGCENGVGGKQTQGALIGGLGGAAAGGLIGGDNALLGALVGGALGAGGGWLIGSELEKAGDSDDARAASERAQNNPVTAAEARDARTADVNNDGYVTLDEVVALDQAGLTDDQIINRLEATDQFFELNREQENYLRDEGVSSRVVVAMRTINEDVRQAAYDRYADDLGLD
jgi:hypothetical protein